MKFTILNNKFLQAVLFASAALSTTAFTQNHQQTVVPVLQTVDIPALNETRKGLEEELKRCCDIKTKVYNAHGSQAYAHKLAKQITAKKPMVAVAIGTSSAQAFLNTKDNVNVVFASVTDPVSAQLVKTLEMPAGRQTGVSNATALAPQLDLFKEIMPNLKILGVIYNPEESNSQILINTLERVALEKGIVIRARLATSASEVAHAARVLVRESDALYINNDNTSLYNLKSIIRIADRSKKAVFVSDPAAVKDGALAALGARQYSVGQKAAMMTEKVLKGNAPENLPVEFTDELELKVNTKVAEKLGLNIPASVLEKTKSSPYIKATEENLKDMFESTNRQPVNDTLTVNVTHIHKKVTELGPLDEENNPTN